MGLKLSETNETRGASESDFKMAVFWDLMSRDQFNFLMMEAAESPEALVHVYQSTQFLTEHIVVH
jgi:hypothetical protein